MQMLFKVCCILMRNAKVNMGQVALCQKPGQRRIRHVSGLTLLSLKAPTGPSPLRYLPQNQRLCWLRCALAALFLLILI